MLHLRVCSQRHTLHDETRKPVGNKRDSAHGVWRQAYLDRQDLGAVHFPDDSPAEEGHCSAGPARDHFLKADRQHEHGAAAADALYIGEGQLLQAVLPRPLCYAGLLRLIHLQQSHSKSDSQVRLGVHAVMGKTGEPQTLVSKKSHIERCRLCCTEEVEFV